MPSGWTLTGLAGNQNTACPAQSTTTDVFEGPSASSACSCGCSLSTPPACPASIEVKYDPGQGAATCTMTGVPATLSPSSACNTDLYKGGTGLLPSYKTMDVQYTPAGPTAGSCAAAGQANAGAVTYAANDRVCTPSPEPCTGNQCMPSFPAGYQVCVEKSGVAACPGAPFTQQHVVGGAATFTCSSSSCSCSVDAGGTCTGSLTLYTSNDCTGNATLTLAADGKCRGAMGSSDTYGSYTYAAAPLSPSCKAGGTSAAQNVALGNAMTVCCAP